MARDRGSDGAAADVVDLSDDLDQDHDDAWDAVPVARRSPEEHVRDVGRAPARRPRWLRSRWALPVVVVVLALLVEVSLGRQFRASAADDLARSEQLSAVQLGGASVVFSYLDVPVRHDAQGRMVTEVQVQVLNSGKQPVTVTVLGTSEPLLQLVDPPATARVVPDGTSTLVVRAAVDCSQVPPLQRWFSSTDDVAAAPPLSLDLAVAGARGGRGGEGTGEGPAPRRRYLVADSGWMSGGMPQQLAWACDPSSSGRYQLSATAMDDGRMGVRVTNSTDTTVRVALQQASWLGVSSQVPLPADVPAGGDLETVLTASPDCGQVPAPSQGGLQPELDVVVPDADGSTRSIQYPPDGQLQAWASRQVALACG